MLCYIVSFDNNDVHFSFLTTITAGNPTHIKYEKISDIISHACKTIAARTILFKKCCPQTDLVFIVSMHTFKTVK